MLLSDAAHDGFGDTILVIASERLARNAVSTAGATKGHIENYRTASWLVGDAPPLGFEEFATTAESVSDAPDPWKLVFAWKGELVTEP